jgi:glycosyltransferase involved in cell wall biosynthesis
LTVLLVDGTTSEHARGIATVIRGVLAELAQTGTKSVVVAGPRLDSEGGHPTRRVGLARARSGRLLYQRLLLPFDAARIGTHDDAVDRVLLLDAYVPLVRPQQRIRYASLVHDVLPLSHPQYWSRAARVVKRIALASLRDERVTLFTSTAFNAREIQRLLGREASVVRFGCGQLTDAEADRALETPLPVSASYLLYVGALEPRKGLMTLFDAFARVSGASDTDLSLVLVGVGSRRHEAALRARVEGSIDGDRIRFVGSPSREETLGLIAHARALVVPTRAEGFCLPVLEAMALGTPVVVSDLPSIRSWADDAVLYAPPRRADGWVEPIRAAIESSVERRRSGQAQARDYRWRECAMELTHF